MKIENNQTLSCPRCGEEYLHHEHVTIYARAEDGIVLKTDIKADRFDVPICVPVLSDQSENPSDRRHGMVISFSCEFCDGTLKLCIAQHKGQTFLSWA